MMTIIIALLKTHISAIRATRNKLSSDAVDVYITIYLSIGDFSVVHVDIDECLEETSNECDVNVECVNTEGSYTCKCRNGYFGNGKTCSGKQYSKFSIKFPIEDASVYIIESKAKI